MKTNLKLYRVTLTGSFGYKSAGQISYVVAENAEDAYQKVKKYLDEKNIGFYKDRTLQTIELLAENTDYPDTTTYLFL